VYSALSEFEFLSILISIVFGLALTHVLSGAVRSVYAGTASETHLVYAAFFIQVLILNWWVGFKWNTHAEWSFETFLILILWAMTHYVMAVTVYPPGSSDDDHDRRSWWFLWAFVAAVSMDIAVTAIRGDLFRPWYYLPFVLHYIALSVIAITINTPSVHRFVSWWFLSTIIVWAFLVRRLLS
jgi:hypothetical protein